MVLITVKDWAPFKVCWPQTTLLRAVQVDPGGLATYRGRLFVNTARYPQPAKTKALWRQVPCITSPPRQPWAGVLFQRISSLPISAEHARTEILSGSYQASTGLDPQGVNDIQRVNFPPIPLPERNFRETTKLLLEARPPACLLDWRIV